MRESSNVNYVDLKNPLLVGEDLP